VFSAHHLPEVIEMGRIYIEAVQIGGRSGGVAETGLYSAVDAMPKVFYGEYLEALIELHAPASCVIEIIHFKLTQQILEFRWGTLFPDLSRNQGFEGTQHVLLIVQGGLVGE